MAIGRLALFAFDCPDPRALAAFYMRIVGGTIKTESEAPDWVRVQLDADCDLAFQLDPNYRPPSWPDGTPQQAHIDIEVDDLDVAERLVLGVGAVKASFQPAPTEWRVFLDPAGHPFCLIQT